MARNIRIRTVEKRELDDDKLALALWLLAKGLEETNAQTDADETPSWPEDNAEAA